MDDIGFYACLVTTIVLDGIDYGRVGVSWCETVRTEVLVMVVMCSGSEQNNHSYISKSADAS